MPFPPSAHTPEHQRSAGTKGFAAQKAAGYGWGGKHSTFDLGKHIRRIHDEGKHFGGIRGADPSEAGKKGGSQNLGVPKPMSGNLPSVAGQFRSFAQKIRHKTSDGWELIDAVYEVFQRARAAQADQLILESATWLADRGFGKPVQVGQLTDAEGNPVAFTLWSPATQEPIGDVITIQNGHVVEDEAQQVYLPPASSLETPKSYEPPPKDSYAEGVAKPWSKAEQEPKRGE